MRDPVLTLLAYRADGADYCRGCLMGSSSSSFGAITTQDKALLARRWAELLREAPSGREYASTEFGLLINGVDATRFLYGYALPGDEPLDLTYEEEQVAKDVLALLEQEKARLAQEAQAEAQAKAQAAEQARQRQAEQAAKAKEAEDRARYAELHARYGKEAGHGN